MTHRLILLRHAKSSWDAAYETDHSRPLNKRGRESAAAIGKWLRAQGYIPDKVFCSNAARTAETWDYVANEISNPPAAIYLQRLYHASASEIADVVKDTDAKTVLVIGHNPGIGDLAEKLAIAPPSHPRFLDYPTAATAIFEFTGTEWSGLRSRGGRLVDFVTPHDLK